MLELTVNTVVLGSIYLLFSLGLSLAWGTIGVLNFAHGAVFMFCAFLDYKVAQHVELPMVALLGLGIVFGVSLSVATQLLAFEPILSRAADQREAELRILIAGIGVATVPLAIAQKETKDNPFGYIRHTSYQTKTYDWGGVVVTNTEIITTVLAVVIAAGLWVWLRRSKSGLSLRAIGMDADTVPLMGVSRRAKSLLIMSVSGALAGLAGVLLTFHLGAIAPETGDGLLVKAFAAVILGGVGSIAGVVSGCLVLALTETLVLMHTSGTWVDAISFGLIFVVLLARPQGLFGRKEVRRT